MIKATTNVLYVEDEISLGQIVKEGLEAEGKNVTWITDGEDVMQSIASSSYDICLLDVMLPNVDGFSLGKEISDKYPRLPIIFLTARNDADDVVEGFKSGGIDYIRKPFSMKELLVRMDSVLGRNKPTQNDQETLNIGQFSFNSLTYELLHEKGKVILTHKEAQLLSLLASTQNQIIRRDHILNTIWEDDSFFHSRRLDVYIKKLRNYLALDKQISIVTLRGLGYRFVVDEN